jgi:hypothetical protein
MTDIEAMAQELDPWKPLVHCARGAYQSLRGDHSVAASELESALGQITAGRHTAWTWTASMYLWALVHARRPQEAIDASRGLLQQAERAQMSELKYALQLPLADAHSLLGHHDEARAIAAAALESQQTVGGIGVPLAAAHETCAWIALRAGDAVSFNEHASVCEAQYRVGNYGPLLARHDKLMRAARKAGLIAPLVEYDSASMHPDDLSSTSTVLSRAQGPAQRAEQALAMLLERCGAKAGCLYVLQRSGPVLAAQQGQMPLPHELDDLVASFVADALTVDDVTRTQPGESLVVSASAWTVGDTAEARFVPMLLSHPTPEGRCVTGVAVTWVARDAGFTLPTRLLQALSSALRDRGDAVTHIIGTAGGDDDS